MGALPALLLGLAHTLVLVFVFVFVATGCAGRPPAPPPPRAIAEAQRIAQQAGELQAAENWAGAAEWWGRAGAQAELLNQVADIALARHNEGVCRRILGQLTEARALFESAAQMNAALELTNAWWRNQVGLLQVDYALGPSPDLASTRLAELLPRAAELEPDPPLAGVFALEVARLRLREDRPAEALAAANEATRHFTRATDPAGGASVLVTTARILEAQGNPAAAERTWRQALASFEALGHPRGVAFSLAGLGSLLATQPERAPEAAKLLRRAADNLRQLRLEPEARDAEGRLEQLRASGTR